MKKNIRIIRTTIVLIGLFLSMNAQAAFTAVTSGSWSSAATWGGVAPGANVSNQDVTIPVGITVTLDQDVTFSGLINSLVVDGTLSSSSANTMTVSSGTLAGNGTVNIHTLSFGTISTASFSGTLTLRKLINQSLALGITATASIADTLFLQGGALTVNTNGNLSMAANSTIKVDAGTIAIAGGILNLTNSYDVEYIGSFKTTGIELNTTSLHHLYVNLSSNSQTLTMNGNTTVNGNVYIGSGKLALNGQQLTMMGDLVMGSGTSINSTATSSLSIQGSSGMSSALMFDTGSSIGDITINRIVSGMVKLGSPVNVAGTISLMDGTFSLENGGALTMNAGSTIHVEKGTMVTNSGTFNGSAAYNVEYMGSTDANGGIELTGAGLNNLTVNYTGVSNQLTLTDTTVVNGSFTMTNGMLDLNGVALRLHGTMSQNAWATLKGNNVSELNLSLSSVSGDTLYFDQSAGNPLLGKFIVNTTGTNWVVMGSPLTVAIEMDMMNGKLELGNGDLTLMSAASIIGYDSTKYIITSEDAAGSLEMNVVSGSSFVTFPVGTSNYSPAQIQQVNGAATGYFKVRAMNTVLSNGTYGYVSSSTAKVVDRTWFINSTLPAINANIKLGWMAASEVNGFDRTNSYITNYGPSGWDVMSPATATPGPDNTYELSRMGITTLYPPFAVTENGQPINIKETMAANGFELYPNPSTTSITVEIGNPKGQYTYELTDLSGRLIASAQSVDSKNKFDVKSLDAGYYFVKVKNLDNNQTFIRKFIKE